jgi:hypothetical protein
MDFIMDLPKSKAGHDAILAVVDKLSKATTLIPTKSTVYTQQVAQPLLKDVYRLHGLPRKIISDRDVRFMGKFWQELQRLVQTKLAMSVGHTLLCIVDWSEAKSQNMHMTTCMIDC